MTIKFEFDLEGVGIAQQHLNDALRDVKIQSELMVVKILEGIARNTNPYVPVDTSTLINSETRQTEIVGDKIMGEISYFATTEDGDDYAVYVHEGGPKNWQKPGASDSFLEFGAYDFVRDDLSTVISEFQP